jgi:hypothetical protein
MSEEIDHYFARCIKNWTVMRSNLPEGKTALLQKAALLKKAANEQNETSALRVSCFITLFKRNPSNEFRYHLQTRYEVNEPLSQSTHWSLRLLLNSHLAF